MYTFNDLGVGVGLNSKRLEQCRRFLGWIDEPGAKDPELPLAQIAELAVAYAEESFARIGGPQRARGLACRRGCHWCCYLPVEASKAEAARALEFARSVLGAQAFDSLKTRIGAAAAAYPLTNTGPLSKNPPCPFLTDGACAVYPARPLACRSWNSRDAGACETAWREGVDTVRVPVDSRIRGVYANASEALNRGLVRGGFGEPGHLVPALAALLAQ
ncbi:MAG TPA: YkgJ family cysteine cluster protein [Gammaproteobacteria bacterium]